MPMQALSLAVVGAAFANKDGSNRLFEIMLCKPGDPVLLVLEPKNKADPNAVAVVSDRGVQIGYVRAERAPLVRGWLLAGREWAAAFQEATAWGAVIRVALDGLAPELPAHGAESASKGSVAEDHDGFWPDELPPDD